MKIKLLILKYVLLTKNNVYDTIVIQEVIKMSIWHDVSTLPPKSYKCGYCGKDINSNVGYYLVENSYTHVYNNQGFIYICHHCNNPTFISFELQVPNAKYGKNFEDKIFKDEMTLKLYKEIQDCMGAGAYSAVGMCCRKLLMHIAVDCGADEDKKFFEYVDYLDTNNYIPANCKKWVDIIRNKGNETNHQIIILNEKDAKQLINFIEILITVIYEMPFQANNYIGDIDE